MSSRGDRLEMRALVGLTALWLCASAQAQSLDDPTRPPPGFRGGAGPARAAGGSEGLVLQSVIISETNRSAIISGEHVALGGKIAGARLVKVSEAAVVLLTGGDRRTLKLFPSVQKDEVVTGMDEGEEP
jgi:hypothetical protein